MKRHILLITLLCYPALSSTNAMDLSNAVDLANAFMSSPNTSSDGECTPHFSSGSFASGSTSPLEKARIKFEKMAESGAFFHFSLDDIDDFEKADEIYDLAPLSKLLGKWDNMIEGMAAVSDFEKQDYKNVLLDVMRKSISK